MHSNGRSPVCERMWRLRCSRRPKLREQLVKWHEWGRRPSPSSPPPGTGEGDRDESELLEPADAAAVAAAAAAAAAARRRLADSFISLACRSWATASEKRSGPSIIVAKGVKVKREEDAEMWSLKKAVLQREEKGRTTDRGLSKESRPHNRKEKRRCVGKGAELADGYQGLSSPLSIRRTEATMCAVEPLAVSKATLVDQGYWLNPRRVAPLAGEGEGEMCGSARFTQKHVPQRANALNI